MDSTGADRGAFIVVVILNWNGLSDTIARLESLQAVEYDNYVVVIVDNGSTHGEADEIELRFPHVHLIRNLTNLGFAGGCNQGIDHARDPGADYVCLLNNDTLVTPGFLGTVVRAYERIPSAGMVAPLILYPESSRIWFAGARVFMGMIRHSNKGQPLESVDLPSKPFRSDYVPGTALLIRLDLIARIGKLDERYFAYYEDLDWCLKAERLGYFPYVEPAAVITHKKSGSTSEGGTNRWSSIPAYLVARNGFLLSPHYRGLRAIIFYFVQIFVKTPLTMAMLVDLGAWPSYLRGLYDGLTGDFERGVGRSLT